mmetsp:Transcript_61840/g.159620  ORF Transcript_61840/g.159620 Transcript_61840/m.159620 type:complete len:275 (+) Transcript_61840:407-1231(+)
MPRALGEGGGAAAAGRPPEVALHGVRPRQLPGRRAVEGSAGGARRGAGGSRGPRTPVAAAADALFGPAGGGAARRGCARGRAPGAGAAGPGGGGRWRGGAGRAALVAEHQRRRRARRVLGLHFGPGPGHEGGQPPGQRHRAEGSRHCAAPLPVRSPVVRRRRHLAGTQRGAARAGPRQRRHAEVRGGDSTEEHGQDRLRPRLCALRGAARNHGRLRCAAPGAVLLREGHVEGAARGRLGCLGRVAALLQRPLAALGRGAGSRVLQLFSRGIAFG